MTTSVWLTTWQLGDDGVRVAVGDHVDWLAFLPTHWEGAQLFAGRRTIDLAVDAHRGAGFFVEESGAVVSSDGQVWAVRGVVAAVEAVTVRYRSTAMGDEAVDGSAVAESIDATDDRSWGMCRAHDPPGFIVTLRDEHVEPTEPTLERPVWSAEDEVVVEHPGPPSDDDLAAFPETLLDDAPWAWPPGVDLDAIEDGAVAYVATYEEPADAASWCRHPSHRA